MASEMAEWLTPWQASERLKQAYPLFFSTEWEPIHVDKYEEMTYFNNERKTEHHCEYDLYFAFTKPGPLYDQRKLKENRQFQQDRRENIFRQELKKAVPATTSLNYGKRPLYDKPEMQFNRIGQIPSFYRRNGVFPCIEKPVSFGCHASPSLQ